MSGGPTDGVASGDDPMQNRDPASESPQPTTAIPQQPPQQGWGQQAWSAQPEYPPVHTPGPQPQVPQYPQQAQYPQQGQYPQQQYPQPGAYPQQYPAYGQQYPQSGQYPQPQYPQQQYPQSGQYPQQPYTYPAQYPTGEFQQPTAAPKSKLPVWIGLGVIAALVAVAVLGLALGGTFGSKTLDRAAAERGVEQVLTGSYGLGDVDDVVCPSDQKVSEGNSFTCTLTVKGQLQQVTVTFTDGAGTYEVSLPTAK